ncbi:centromere protein F isoform X1 [Gadus morhua]|uniref:Centromere protein F n=1 Tax=Gadus morhua TaxID=8049 RepID=A0A8C5BSM9_GADMO|nr:centromere protein F isoform X1 [Gadus morhua]
MSWAVEEWKDGLPAKALQKILEIEGQLDKLKKERTQKQFQLDSLEAALQKQKQKVDSERSDASHLKRENQTLLESCDSLEKSRQKVVHDLGIKEQQVSYLDGQLSASKRTIERLEQELKKYKNESDRSSSSSSSLSSSSCSELQAYATPLKSFPAPSATPGHRQQDNRLEELQGKYSQEVDERKRLETELKVLQVKMLNQSSTTVSHKDIAARQQAGSSIFPWQKSDQPQSRPSQVPLDTPIKRCGGGGSSLWDAHDETPIKPSQRMSSSAVAQSPAGSSDQMKQLKALNQELRGCMSELERNLASQEKEIRGQSSRLQELQIQLDQSRRELVDRDRDLAKTRHELTQASAKHQQSEDKCSSLELKLKQVTEEMGCQRHNAETCKRALEQKIKDQERTNQKELAQLQSSQHALEQTLNQTKSKLTQEIQQAKKDHNMLEAEMEKVGHQKSQMQRDVEEHRQKLLRSEQGLQTSQSKEQDLRKKMEELLKEKNSVSVQLDQGSRRLSQLEEEKKSSEQSFKRTQGLLDDMKAKWEAQTEEVKGLKCKLEQQTQSSSKELDNLRKALSDAEAKTNSSQSELQKQKRETEQLSDRLAVLEKEGQALGASLASSQRECTEQRLEHQALLAWKAEKEALIDQTEAVQGVLRENISRLESAISQLNKDHDELKGQLNGVEAQRAGLSAQIDSLKGELLNKSTELEVRERQYEDAQAQLSEAGQKHAKDLDNIGVQVALLQEQVGALEARLQQEAGRADRAEVSRAQLQEQHQTTCDLLLSKEQMLELGQAETSQLRDSLALASEQQDAQNHRLMEEKLSMQSQCEETVAEKAEEAEQAKLELIKIQQDLMLSEDKISSLQSALKIQKSLGAGLQGQIDTLSAAEEEQKQALNATSEALNQTRQEVKALQSQAEDKEKLLLDAEHKITALEEQTAALETKAVELKAEAENLQHTHTEEGDGLRAQLTALSEEVTRSKALAEQLPALKAELEAAKKSCGSLQNALEAAQESHAPCADNAAGLERSLAKTAGLLGPLETQVRELSEGRARQEESHVREMEGFLHKQKALKEQLAASREAERAATEELAARREQVANMKRSLSAASAGLQEQDGAVKGLKERLNRAEAAHTKASDSLKEKTVAMDKIKVLMEMLQMDLEDTETARTSFDGQVEELKGTIALLERQKTDLEVRLEDSQAQVSVLETRLEEVQSSNATLESQYETAQEHLLEWSNRGPHTEEGVSDLLSDCYQQLEKSEILSKIVNKEKEMLVEDVSVLEARNEKLLTNSSILESRFQPMLRSNRVAHSFFNQEYGKLHVAYEQMVEETARLEAEIHGLHEERKISDRRATEDNFEMFIKLQYLTKAKVLAEAKVHQLIEEKAEAKLTEDEAEIPDLNKVSDENNELETSLNRLAEERLQLESAIRLLTGDKVQRQTSLDLLAEEKRQLHASMDPAQLMAPANDESRQHWDAVRRLAERIQETKKKSDCRDFRGRQFESERELHEKKSGLQKELVLFKEQFDALLEKANQHYRVIQQLSETQGSPGCMDTASPSHGDQQVVGHIQPASCQPDEMESSMEVPAERHSTMAAPDADQDEPPNRPVDTARRSFHDEQPCRGVAEARCPAAEATACGGDLARGQQSPGPAEEEEMEPCSTPPNMNLVQLMSLHVQVLMEMLQMDLEDTEMARTSFDGQVEELKGTIALLERQKTDLEVRLEDSQAQVSVLETRLKEVQSSNATLESQYETAQEHLLEWSNRGPHTEEGVSDLLSDCYQQLEKYEILSKIVNKEKEMLVEDVSVLEARNEKLLTNCSLLESRFLPVLRSYQAARSSFNQVNQEFGQLHVAYEQMVEETARLEAEIHWLHEERKISDGLVIQADSSKEAFVGYFLKFVEITAKNVKMKQRIQRATEENIEMAAKLQHLTEERVWAEAKLHQLIEEKAEAKLNEDEAQIPELTKVSDQNKELETSLKRLAEERLQLESAIRLLTGDNVQRQTSLDLLTEEKRQLHASMDPAQLMNPANEESRQHWDAVRRLAERNQEIMKLIDSRDFRGRQFEPERELHEKTSGLQKELVLFKEQYAALLEKVDQQHRVIQQLSETQGSPGCMDTASPSHGDQQVVGHIQPASCQPDEMESSMEAPAERHSTMAAPDADQDEPPNRPVDTARRSFHHEQPCRGVAEARCPAAEDEGPKMNLPEPHQLQADLDQSRDKMRLLEEELQSLRSEVLLLTSDLSLRKELSSELQGKVDQLELMLRASEVQGGGTAGKLTLTLQESRGFEKQVFQLSEERDALTLQLQTAKEQLVDIMQMMEGMEMAKGGWDEKFLQQESELRRVRSEKANLEQHILGMESELEALQEHRGTLERVLETQRRACSGLELQVDTLRTESTQLRAELVSCTEERDEASRAVGRWRQEVHSLEKTNVDTRQLISILEEDIRVGRREYEALQSNAERLDGEKQQLRGQVGALEQELCEHRGQREELLSQLDRVTEDQNSACHNSESMASKIQALEADLSRMTQSLESSLLEKGEIASRLNSTQGEVQNMRSGIEKLQVRIESDERKKKKIGELLKDAQRKSDSLQDRIDALEREKEGTEQSLEEAVIQAEIAKAEIEELEDERKKVEEEKSSLGEKLSALAAELDHLRQEKEAMEGELEAKSRVIEELRAAKEELERGMERAETGRREEQERQRSVVEGMEREAESERAEALEKWSRERQALEASVSKLEEELRGLHSGLAEAEAEWARREQESDSRGSEERDALRGTISSLEGEASVLAEENQRASAKLSSLEEEKEKLISSLASLENEKESANAALALSQTEKSRLEEEKEALRSSLSSLEAERDRLTGEQQDLQATLSSLEAELETCRQSLSQATQQVSELSGQVGALAKGRDSALSKMNLWMKTCQQLQQEKETLEQSSGAGSSTEASAHGEEARLLAEQRQAAVTAELETTRKELEAVTAELETTRKELEEVTAELEERSREADESLDKYCSLMVQVHKLEEANETLSARLQRGTTPAPATATPAPAAATTPTPTKRLSRRLSKRQEVAPEVDAKNPTPSPVLPGSTARALSLGKRLHLANRDAAAHTPAKAQEALYNLTKRIKAGVATPQPGGPQDEEFRPEGLPELVQRGFADIPMGEASPFIMRRTTAKRRSSRLSSRRTPAAADRTVTQSPLADGKVSGHLSLTSPAVAAVTPAGSPAGRAGRRSLSLQKTPEQREKRREALREQAQQGENCQVQ